MSLNKLDKHILYELDVNARQSLSAIAKKLKINKDTLKYRIKRCYCSICANFFPAENERMSASRVLTHACVIHNFSKGEKRGTQCAERLKRQEMSRSEKMDSVLRNNFAGGRIRKTETKDF